MNSVLISQLDLLPQASVLTEDFFPLVQSSSFITKRTTIGDIKGISSTGSYSGSFVGNCNLTGSLTGSSATSVWAGTVWGGSVYGQNFVSAPSVTATNVTCINMTGLASVATLAYTASSLNYPNNSTSSFAISSSYSLASTSASYSLLTTSASYALTSSVVVNVPTASYCYTSSWAITALNPASFATATSASWASMSLSSVSSSWASASLSSSYALTASYSLSGSYALMAGNVGATIYEIDPPITLNNLIGTSGNPTPDYTYSYSSLISGLIWPQLPRFIRLVLYPTINNIEMQYWTGTSFVPYVSSFTINDEIDSNQFIVQYASGNNIVAYPYPAFNIFASGAPVTDTSNYKRIIINGASYQNISYTLFGVYLRSRVSSQSYPFMYIKDATKWGVKIYIMP